VLCFKKTRQKYFGRKGGGSGDLIFENPHLLSSIQKHRFKNNCAFLRVRVRGNSNLGEHLSIHFTDFKKSIVNETTSGMPQNVKIGSRFGMKNSVIHYLCLALLLKKT